MNAACTCRCIGIFFMCILYQCCDSFPVKASKHDYLKTDLQNFVQYSRRKHSKIFSNHPSTDSFASFLKLLRRRRQLLSGEVFVDVLRSCTSEQCQSAFNGANYFTSAEHFNDAVGLAPGIYLSNDEDVWYIEYCNCMLIYKHSEPVSTLAVGVNGLHWISSDGTLITTLSNATSSATTSTNPVATSTTEVLDAVCNNVLLIEEEPIVLTINGSYISFNVSSIIAAQSSLVLPECRNFSGNDSLTFSFIYQNTFSSSCVGKASCTEQIVFSTADTVTLKNLTPNTTYQMHFTIRKRHGNATYQVLSQPFNVTTTCGVSSPVSNLMCEPLSFSGIRLTWQPPTVQNTVELRYTIETSSTNESELGNVLRYDNLSADKKLTYQVKAYASGCPSAEGQYSFVDIQCPPLQELSYISINKTTSNTIKLIWLPFPPGQVVRIVILWGELSGLWVRSFSLPGTATEDTITDLKPDTAYKFNAEITYVNGYQLLSESNQITAKTRMGVPQSPMNVRIINGSQQDPLVWDAPTINANSIRNYTIEARNRSAPTSPHILFGKWSVVQVVSALSERTWTISNQTDKQWYEFRVFATNDVGRGDASLTTNPYYYTVPVDNSRFLWIVIGSTIGSAIFIFVIIVSYACWRCRLRRKKKQARKNIPAGITTIHVGSGMDMELAHIRHMTTLAMAAANHDGPFNLPTDYRSRLPLFPRDQLKLGELLGRGAFGEVYSGIAVDIKGGDAGVGTSVAVKTLKDGSSDREKCEFLMEAYFMSLFDHPNIISLLGVCLDNEPQFLILELMEGGDLLKYMQEARLTMITAKLNIMDLLEICLDLAAGCQYLENKHFIHRDLAARNCLVSTKDYRTNSRVVKIGDFGLARDIYKNDYYHKEGDGLLPVRWMALESLLLKRYTVQSDVWSFGVVLWEVMTFGQQPYPVYNNVEVIHFVKGGGRLDQPNGCPDEMYDLMKRCWNVEPSERPSFFDVFETVQGLMSQCSYNQPVSMVGGGSGPISYSSVNTFDDPVFIGDKFFDNRAFVSDEGESTTDHSLLENIFTETCPSTSPKHVHSLRPSFSTSESEKDTMCMKPPPPNINYAQLGFAPSRETSVKSVINQGGSNNEESLSGISLQDGLPQSEDKYSHTVPPKSIQLTSQFDPLCSSNALEPSSDFASGFNETRPLKTYNSDAKPIVNKNKYVKMPVNTDSLQLSVLKSPFNENTAHYSGAPKMFNQNNNANVGTSAQRPSALPRKKRRQKRYENETKSNGSVRSNRADRRKRSENSPSVAGKIPSQRKYMNETKKRWDSSSSEQSVNEQPPENAKHLNRSNNMLTFI